MQRGLKDVPAITKIKGRIQRNNLLFLSNFPGFCRREVHEKSGGFSDVKHRFAGVVGEGFQGDGVEGLLKAGGDLFPCMADRLAGFSAAGDRALEERGVHGLDDLAQADGFRGAGEAVAAGLAAAAFDETGTAEVVENLDEKISGDGFSLRQVLEACKSSGVMVFGELSQCPARVFQLL